MTRTSVFLSCALLALAGLRAAPADPAYLGVQPAGHAAAASRTVKSTCSACHGMHGNSRSADFPNLAGQNYNYLLKQLEDFANGKRKASPMSQLVQSLSGGKEGKTLQDLAAYFAAAKLDRSANANAQESKPPADTASRGYRIFQAGVPAARVPACSACHLPSGTGMAPMAVPALAGQHAKYVQSELQRFADGKRDNSPHHVMQLIAKRLDAKQMHDVALYLQAMRPASMLGAGPKTYGDYVASAKKDPVPGIPKSDLAAAGGGRKQAQAAKNTAAN